MASDAGLTLGLAHHASAWPQRAAVIFDQHSCTYGELNQRVNRLANALQRAGVAVGDTIAAVLHSRIEWLEVLNAAGKIGARMVPIGYRLKGPEIAYMVRDSAAGIIIGEPALRTEIDRAIDELQWPEDRLWVTGPAPAWRGRSYEGLVAEEGAEEPQGAFTGGGFAVLVYTSGTTGRPKGIERQMDPATAHLQLAGVAQMWGLGSNDVHLIAGPLYHTGPAGYAQAQILVGGTVVLMDHFDARRALELIARHRVTNTFMVPTHFARILQLSEAERKSFDLSSVRLVLHSAAPCPMHIKRGIMEVFPPHTVTEFYGASESGFTRITAEEWVRKPGSVGRPWPGHELRVRREDGSDCETGEIGLIYVKGPRLDFRYRDAPEKDAAAFRDGFFTAGDLGSIDRDGYLFVADRRTDLIITGGANVYPAEVESVLLQHPEVADVAVIGVPDDEMGKAVVAVVEPEPGAALDAGTLIAFCRRDLAHYKCPRRIEFVAVLPREPSGKVRKHELVEGLRAED